MSVMSNINMCVHVSRVQRYYMARASLDIFFMSSTYHGCTVGVVSRIHLWSIRRDITVGAPTKLSPTSTELI